MKRKEKGVKLMAATCMCAIMTIPMNVLSSSYAAEISLTKEQVEKEESYFKGTSKNKSQQYLGGMINSTWGYKYIKGTKPVLITVPHSVNQDKRDGYDNGYGYKSADKYTGAIARIIAEKTGAHVLYKTTYKADNDAKPYDENHTNDLTNYRKKIRNIVRDNEIKAVIDIHGFNDAETDDSIVIGTSYGENLLGQDQVLNAVLDGLAENGFKTDMLEAAVSKNDRVTIDERFTASASYTSSAYVAENFKVPTIQLEFGTSYRVPTNDMKKFNRTVNSISDIIARVSNVKTNNNDVSDYAIAQIDGVKAHANLRKEKTTNSALVDEVKKGHYVTVIDDATTTWVKVKYNNKKGYISNKYLKFLQGTVQKTNHVDKYIYVRSEANEDAKKLGKVAVGETVDILGMTSNSKWYKVRYKDAEGKYITGYAYKSAIEINE